MAERERLTGIFRPDDLGLNPIRQVGSSDEFTLNRDPRLQYDPKQDPSDYPGTPSEFFGGSDDSLPDIFSSEQRLGVAEKSEQPVAPEGILQQILQNPNIQKALAIGGAGLAGPFAAQAAGKQFDASEAQRRQQKQLKLENEARARQELRDIENLEYERERKKLEEERNKELFGYQIKEQERAIDESIRAIAKNKLGDAKVTAGGLADHYFRITETPSLDGWKSHLKTQTNGAKLIKALGDDITEVYENSFQGNIERKQAQQRTKAMLDRVTFQGQRLELNKLEFQLSANRFTDSMARQDHAQGALDLKGLFYKVIRNSEQDPTPITTLEQAEDAIMGIEGGERILNLAKDSKYAAFEAASTDIADKTLQAADKIRNDAREVVWKNSQLGIQTAQSVFDTAEMESFNINPGSETVTLKLPIEAQSILGQTTIEVPAKDAILAMTRLKTFLPGQSGITEESAATFATRLAIMEFEGLTRASQNVLIDEDKRPPTPDENFLTQTIAKWYSFFWNPNTQQGPVPTTINEGIMPYIRRDILNRKGLSGYDEEVKNMIEKGVLDKERAQWLMTNKLKIQD